MHFDRKRDLILFLLIFLQFKPKSCRLLEDREVICSSDRMVINLSFERPFRGVVFSEGNFGVDECKWTGNGGHYLLVIVPLDYNRNENATKPLTNEEKGSRLGFCGLHFNQKTGKHSMNFVVSPDSTILTEEAISLAAHCVQSTEDIVMTLNSPSFDSGSIKISRAETIPVLANSTDAPALSLRILTDHGLLGNPASDGMVGKRLTLDAQLEDTSIFDMFIHDCIAHDGTRSEDATVPIVDANGCAVKLTRAIDAPVFTNAPQQNSSKHVYVHIYGFQFTSSDLVHFECQATTCVNECPMKQCQDPKVFQPRLAAAALGQLQTHTIRSHLQIIPQNANAHTQAMQRNPQQCLDPSTAGLVCAGTLLIFITLSYFTRKLIYSYQKFLRDSQ